MISKYAMSNYWRISNLYQFILFITGIEYEGGNLYFNLFARFLYKLHKVLVLCVKYCCVSANAAH